MARRRIRIVALSRRLAAPTALVALLVGCSQPVAPPVAQQRGVEGGRPSESHAVAAKVALIVGVDHYASNPSKGPPPVTLSGAVNDARQAAALLIERFGFKAEDVRLLTDQEATHARIVREFHDWLIERSGPRTEALFWYSGHGSRVADASGHAGTEEENMDSTLVAYDGRASASGRCFDITDDELYSLLRKLCKCTERVTLVTDSCHAGGVTRGGGELPPRYEKPAGDPLDFARDLAPFWPKDVEFVDDGDPRRLETLHYVHLAACAPSEVANELRVPQADGTGAAHGAFSFFLFQALASLQPGTTYQQLERDVAVRLGNRFPGQRVVIEGDERREVLAADFAPALPGFQASVVPASRCVDVAAGELQLLRAGSVLEITRVDRTKLGRAVVKTIEPASCRAQWVGEPPPLTEVTAVQATEIERPAGWTPLRVFVAPAAALDPVAELLAQSGTPPITVTRTEKDGAAYRVVAGADDHLELVTDPDGFLIWDEAAPQARETRLAAIERTLLPVLAKQSRLCALRALPLQHGRIPVEVELSGGDAREPGGPTSGESYARVERVSAKGIASAATVGWRVGVAPGAGVRDFVTVSVSVDPKKFRSPVYVYGLCASEDGSVGLLWPRLPNRLTPGTPLRFEIQVFETLSPGGGRPLRDRILVVATEQPADFTPYEQGKALIDATEAPALTRGGDGLPPILEEALAPRATRGATYAPAERQDFGVAGLDMVVEAR